MANALEQAVETVEPDTIESLLPPEEVGIVVPETNPEPDQASEPEFGTDPEDISQHPPATLHGRYLIFPAMPLPALDSPTAKAYAVEDRTEPKQNLFALVCSPMQPTATHVMKKIREASITGLLPLLDYGPTFWSPLGQKCMIVIFQRPLGGRFIDSFGKVSPHLSEYEIGAKYVEPLIKAFQRLSGMGLTHRAVRLDNLYYMDEEKENLVLGECVSTPPGHDQPVLYESVECAMAMPSGRGPGFIGDDLYALGIGMVILLLSKDPTRKLSNDEIVHGKCDQGTYPFLCSKERIPLQLIEIVRGLLADAPEERWDIEAICRWTEGQKAHVTQRKSLLKAKSPYIFMDKELYSPRSIAYAFSKNITEATKAIRGGKLDAWLRKALNQPEMADSISALITLAKVHTGKPEGSDEILISKSCMRLDPLGPVRYKDFFFMPDGFGEAFASEYFRKSNFQVPAEILARDLVGYYLGTLPVQSSDVSNQLKTFKTLNSFAKLNEMGFGMERCLYELNKTLPCQSEFLRLDFVYDIESFLPTLDTTSSKADQQTRPMDKHMAAFIATHFNQDIAPHLKALCDPREETSMIGLLSLYALMQWRMGHEHLFGLTEWLGNLLQPAINTYHSRTTQQTIAQEIPSLVRQGSLPDLFDLIDNSVRRHNDALAFKQAQFEFSHAESEIQSFVGEDVDQEEMAVKSGEQATAMTSVIVGMIGSVIIIFVMIL